MSFPNRIHVLGHEDARLLTPGFHMRAWGRLRDCCCKHPSNLAIIRLATGDTWLVKGCKEGISANAGYVVIRRDRGLHREMG